MSPSCVSITTGFAFHQHVSWCMFFLCNPPFPTPTPPPPPQRKQLPHPHVPSPDTGSPLHPLPSLICHGVSLPHLLHPSSSSPSRACPHRPPSFHPAISYTVPSRHLLSLAPLSSPPEWDKWVMCFINLQEDANPYAGPTQPITKVSVCVCVCVCVFECVDQGLVVAIVIDSCISISNSSCYSYCRRDSSSCSSIKQKRFMENWEEQMTYIRQSAISVLALSLHSYDFVR